MKIVQSPSLSGIQTKISTTLKNGKGCIGMAILLEVQMQFNPFYDRGFWNSEKSLLKK